MPLPPLTSSASESSLPRLDENRRQRLQHLLTRAQRGTDHPCDVPSSQAGSQGRDCRKCGAPKPPSASSRDPQRGQSLRKVESLPNLPPVREALPPVQENRAETGPQAQPEKRRDKRRNALKEGQVDEKAAAAVQDGEVRRRERKSGSRPPRERGTFYDNVLSESSFKQEAVPIPVPQEQVEAVQRVEESRHKKRRSSTGKKYSPRTQRAGEYVRGLIKGSDGAAQEWKLHEELEAVDHFLAQDQVKQQEAEKLKRYREGLAQQKNALDQSRENQRKEYVDWGQQICDDAERYKAEEHQKKQDRLSFEKRFNEERAAQYADILNRKKQAQDEADRIEQDLVARAIKEKRDEETRDALRKQHQREQQEKIAAEALVAMKRREEEKGLERQRDIRLMLEQKAMMDKQERDRAMYFENLKNKSLAKQAAYEAGAGNELARKQQEDEERARREQLEELERVKKDEQDRASRKKRLQQEGFDAVKLQLENHAKEREHQREEDRKFGQAFRQEAKQAQEEEQEKIRQRRRNEEENQAFLKKQMAEKSAVIPGRFGHQRMNEVERSINKDKIDRALDPARPDGLQLLFRQKQLQYQHSDATAAK